MSCIGRYEIEREIGRGSMGIVYLAHDPHVRRRVALKTFLLPPGQTPQQEREYSARFLREAQAAGGLSHPSIVTIFDADTDPDRGLPFIVMELVEGESLRDLLIREKRLDAERALTMASALADALRAAHVEGIVHRDIKPANVLIRARDGQAKIVDFGVARMSTSELTSAGDIFGSPAYMSPEQFRGAAVDARSDLFSLATILYQMLCGDRPFAGDDMSALAYAVVHTPAAPIASRLQGSAREMDRFFDKALAKDPADRFPDAASFREAVDELRRALSLQATVALDALRARRTFALPVLGSPTVASIASSARESWTRLRRSMAAARDDGTPRSRMGIKPLEGAIAIVMLVLAVLPGVWALWSPATPQAEALSASQTGEGAQPELADSESGPRGARGSASRLDDRSGSDRSAVDPAGPSISRSGRKPPAQTTQSRTAADASRESSTKAGGGTPRPGRSTTDAARARTAWAPRGSAPTSSGSGGSAAESPSDATLASISTPMSRDPLARRIAAATVKGSLVIDVRSLVKDGALKLLVDGREVHHRRLSSLEAAGAQPKKLFHRREEVFTVRLEVAPGTHTVAAQVFTGGKDEGREDSTQVTVEASETTRLRLVAGRILGSSVSLKQD